MRNLWPIVLLIGLCACSEKTAQPAVKSPAVPHKYSVSVAAVKIPDAILKSLGLPAFEEASTLESRRKLAAYVAAHPADFSVRKSTGNIVPIVWSNGKIDVEILSDPAQETKDFETFGMMTKEFVAGVSIRDENDRGEVYGDWYCNCGVHFEAADWKFYRSWKRWRLWRRNDYHGPTRNLAALAWQRR